MRRISWKHVCAIGLAFSAMSVASFGATLSDACGPPSSSAPPCSEYTSSLGRFIVTVTNPLVQAALTGNPNYDPTTHIFLSPLLYDPTTTIFRTAPFLDGSLTDTTDPNAPATPPSGWTDVPGNNEIHTEITNLNLTAGSFAVRAGTSAPGAPRSFGEVESSQPTPDFPAASFFDVFVEIDTPLGTLHNTAPLIVEANPINQLPPTVVYIHGSSVSHPSITFLTGPFAGLVMGDLRLAGHGAGFGLSGVPGGGPAAFDNEFRKAVDSSFGPSSQEAQFIKPLLTPEPSPTILLAGGFLALGLRRLSRKG